MRIGVDFDNTIACYDTIFHRVAVERGLVPAHFEVSKNTVRDYLRSVGREDAWTEMQGYVYGARMAEVQAYPGALQCLAAWNRAGIPVFIISHKTRFPYQGELYDLQQAAWEWLEQLGALRDSCRAGVSPAEKTTDLPRERIFFELSKEAKLARIDMTACTHFIDDLPEFLAAPAFPGQVERILFDPHDVHADEQRFRRVRSWQELERYLRPATACDRQNP